MHLFFFFDFDPAFSTQAQASVIFCNVTGRRATFKMELASSQPEIDQWLASKLVAGREADVTDIITQLTENCSLEELREALGRQVAGTTAQLVQATNRDYSAFVTLSAALETTHGALLKLRAPTADAVQALHNLQDSLNAQQNLRKVQSAEVAREENARNALEHYLEAFDAWTQAQDVLADSSGQQQAAGTVTAATATGGASEADETLGGVDVGIDLYALLSSGRSSSADLLSLRGVPPSSAAPLPAATGTGRGGAQGRADVEDGLDSGHEEREATLATFPVGLLASIGGGLHVSGHMQAGAPPSRGGSEFTCLTLFRAACAVRCAWAACGQACALIKGRGGAQAGQGQGEVTLTAVHALQRQLSSWARAVLLPALTQATVEAARLCCEDTRHRHTLTAALAAWVELGPAGPGLASSALVDALVAPALRTTLSPPRLDDGLRGSLRGLPHAMEEVLAMVGGKGVHGCNIQALQDAASGLPGYDVLTACLWTPLVSLLTGPTLSPMLLTPSLPQAFHSAYSTVGQAFARLRMVGARAGLVPALCYGPECEGKEPLVPWEPTGPVQEHTHTPASASSSYPTAATAMLASPATATLAAAWSSKLGLYAQLRGAETGGKLNKALAARVTLGDGGQAMLKLALEDLHAPGTAAGSDGVSMLAVLLGEPPSRLEPAPHACLSLPASAALWAALQASWSPAVFLPPLLGHTVAQSCALLGRYGTWVLAAVACAAVRGRAYSVCEALGLGGALGEAEGGGEGGQEGSAPRLVPPPPGSASLALTAPAGGASVGGQGVPTIPVRSLQQLPPLPPVWRQQLAVDTIIAAVRGGKGGGGQGGTAAGLPPSHVSSSPSSSTTTRPQVTVLSSAGEGDAVGWAAASANMDCMLALTQDVAAVSSCAPYYVLARAVSSQGKEGDGEESVAQARALAKPVLTSAASLAALLPYLLASLEAPLARACCQSFVTGMRGVPTAVRVGQGGGKTLPRTASPYASAALKPMKQALAHAAFASCTAAAGPVPRAALVSTLCITLLSCVQDSLKAALAGVQAMEASVGWLKGPATGGPASSAAAAASAPAGVTDSDRITCQLWLDCRAVGQAVAEELSGVTGYAVRLQEGAGAEGQDLRLVCQGSLDASMTELCLAVAQAYDGCAVKVRPYSSMARVALG